MTSVLLPGGVGALVLMPVLFVAAAAVTVVAARERVPPTGPAGSRPVPQARDSVRAGSPGAASPEGAA